MTKTKLFSVQVNPSHQPSGGTRHLRDGASLPPPRALELVRVDSGFFLYYLDDAGNPQTDTWHHTLEDAFEQARFEFGVDRSDWIAEDG